jgi:hypothetical protein
VLAAAAIVTVLISTPVQMFMAWRISVITGGIKIALLICLFSLISFGTCILSYDDEIEQLVD